MKYFDQLFKRGAATIARIGGEIQHRRDQRNFADRVAKFKNQSARSFLGGLPSRTTANWTASNTSLDQDLRSSLDALRARSRNLSQNNPYAAKFLRMVEINVVGHQGFGLQAHCGDFVGGKFIADTAANDAVEAAWARWQERGVADVTGQLSFNDLCRLAMSTIARDGECIIRRVRDGGVNEFGYSLQVLDIDRLLVMYSGLASNGNIIRMGVELNDYGKPVAYWVLKNHPGEYLSQATQIRYERILAEDLFHLYLPTRPEQRRGFPWMSPVLESMYHLDQFDQSAMLAARKGADTLGFFVSPDGQPPGISDGQDADGNPIEVSVPGSYDTLPEGYDFKAYESAYPSDVYGTFSKAALRRIASGLNVAFHALGNDLTEVSFSSIRSGTLDERDAWMTLQDWFRDAFITPCFLDWLETSLLRGAITLPGGSALPATKLAKFKSHTFQGRRWAWVDPRSDMEAAILAVQNGFKSRSQVIAEMGLDRETVWRELQQEMADAQAMGLELGGTASKSP